MVIGTNEEGPYDPRVAALRLDRADGSPLAIWFSHATHPVTFGSDNVRFSAELAHQMLVGWRANAHRRPIDRRPPVHGGHHVQRHIGPAFA